MIPRNLFGSVSRSVLQRIIDTLKSDIVIYEKALASSEDDDVTDVLYQKLTDREGDTVIEPVIEPVIEAQP